MSWVRARRTALAFVLALGIVGVTAAPAAAVTVTPNGTFIAKGLLEVTGAFFGTVTCNVDFAGNLAEGGTGSFFVIASLCTDGLFTACTLAFTTSAVSVTISNGNGDYSVTTAETMTINDAPGGFTCGLDCSLSASAKGLTGTVNTTANDAQDSTASLRLGGTMTSTTTSCNGAVLTSNVLVTSINGVVTSTLRVTTT